MAIGGLRVSRNGDLPSVRNGRRDSHPSLHCILGFAQVQFPTLCGNTAFSLAATRDNPVLSLRHLEHVRSGFRFKPAEISTDVVRSWPNWGPAPTCPPFAHGNRASGSGTSFVCGAHWRNSIQFTRSDSSWTSAFRRLLDKLLRLNPVSGGHCETVFQN